ncbi:MAG TPA: hypothetical protein VNN77_11630 [candidate division Zixibacteria bacterium]|nr:hypothetical protein [candidate division Zixibacteria bacterium]
MQLPGAAECLDLLYRDALRRQSTADALGDLRRLEAGDADLRRDCHPVAHAIGRETFLLKGNIHDSFAACDQTCHSGCYHGAVERFLRGDGLYEQAGRHPSQAELREKAASACDPQAPLRLRFQCLHGLGHALLFFARYRLNAALEICDGLPDDWSRDSCYGGVFMENVSAAAPEKRDLSATDYHYPCNAIDAKYRPQCYLMQTSRMIEMGVTGARLFAECGRAGEFRIQCVMSIGRDVSNDVRLGRIKPAAEKCELASEDQRLACMRGVVYALVDHSWDGRYAFPFCSAFDRGEDRAACLREAAGYLKTVFEKSAREIREECAAHLNQPRLCPEIGRSEFPVPVQGSKHPGPRTVDRREHSTGTFRRRTI